MKGRDIAFFVSIQGVLLGSAFLLSSGGAQVEATSHQTQQHESHSWIEANPTTQAIAHQMNMPNSASVTSSADANAVSVALESARQERSWVF